MFHLFRLKLFILFCASYFKKCKSIESKINWASNFFFFFFEEQKTFFWNPTYTLQTIAKINYTSQRTLPMIISPFVPSPLLLHYSSINCCWPIITSPSTFFQMTFFAQANHFYTIFFFFLGVDFKIGICLSI